MQTDNKLLLAAIESVFGTVPAMTGADAVLVSELDVQTPNDVVERNLARGYLGAQRKRTTNRRQTTSFGVLAGGSGVPSTPPAYGKFLRACGFQQFIDGTLDILTGTMPSLVLDSPPVANVQYKPRSSGFESIALRAYMDRNTHTSGGNYGTWSLTLPSGDFPEFEFEFTGDYDAPADSAPATPTYANAEEPVIGSSSNVPLLALETENGSGDFITMCASEISFDAGNDVQRRQQYNCENSKIGAREITGSITFDALQLTDFDPYDIWSVDDLIQFQVQHGIIAGNIMQIYAPQLQILEITYGEDNGTLQHTINFQLVPLIGNDDILFTFS